MHFFFFFCSYQASEGKHIFMAEENEPFHEAFCYGQRDWNLIVFLNDIFLCNQLIVLVTVLALMSLEAAKVHALAGCCWGRWPCSPFPCSATWEHFRITIHVGKHEGLRPREKSCKCFSLAVLAEMQYPCVSEKQLNLIRWTIDFAVSLLAGAPTEH